MPPPKEPLLPRAPTTTDAAPVENLTLQRLDAICTRLEGEQVQILSILNGLVSDMNEMKRLLLLIRPERTDLTPKLPLHIQEKIMKRLPVKSLIRFRCVSKSWKSLIDSSQFIAAHSVLRHNQPQHLLVWYINRHGNKCVSFVDDDSFPHRSFVPILPRSLRCPRVVSTVVGSSYGLLCLEGSPWGDVNKEERMVVIWNPSIRKSIAIDVPKRLDENYREMKAGEIIGFGVCPVTIDPKIVDIIQPRQFGSFWKVNVYKLSSGNFRNLSSSNNIPSVSVRVEDSSQVVIDRFIYWCAVDEDCEPDFEALQFSINLVMSFDITDEIFKVVDLPDHLASRTRPGNLSVSKLRESLVMLEYNKEPVSCGVWKMTDQRLFTKLFTINAPCESWIWKLGFRNRGEPITVVIDSTFGRYLGQLVLYEPITKHCNDLIIRVDAQAITSVDPYMETLLLIDRSDDCTSF